MTTLFQLKMQNLLCSGRAKADNRHYVVILRCDRQDHAEGFLPCGVETFDVLASKDLLKMYLRHKGGSTVWSVASICLQKVPYRR